MLNKLDIQLTNSQLFNFFVENNYTDYFSIQQTLSDLVSSKFVDMVVIRNTSYYSITPEGYASLAFFKNQIPKDALENVNRFLEENRYALKNEVGTQSDYYKHINGDYIAHCQITEGKSLLYDINISVPSEDEAKRICHNFKNYSEDIYAYMMKNLLQ